MYEYIFYKAMTITAKIKMFSGMPCLTLGFAENNNA